MNILSRAEYRNRIEQVVIFIHEHLHEPLDLKKLAEASNFSPYHFHRIFHGAMTETPQDYITRLRVERAANFLMKNHEMSITDIALACGYSSSSTFARAFKNYYGVTAREYSKGRNLRSLADACNCQVCTMAVDRPAPVWQVTMRDVPDLHIAYLVNLKGYSLPEICETWQRLDHWAQAHSVYHDQTMMLGITLDDPTITPAKKCRYIAGITIPPEIKKDRMVGFLGIPAQTCAVFHVECRADQIQGHYQSIYKDWLPDSGMQPGDFPCYEVYLQTPDDCGSDKFVLDIHIPLVPIK